MHVNVLEHIVSLSYRTNRWIFTKREGRSAHGPLQVSLFSVRPVQGRIQGGAIICHGGHPLQRTSSSDRKATTANRMHSNDLQACGMKCCFFFWFHSEVKHLTRF